ncbi:hypothetical protein QR98_0050320 [Sarcoptes scabiei]|uniref:Uncharacterized protein n=1 Tax=Sarcoptes scabiei TaxID=52283 RepID=A0A132A7D8_SARSC|nr:hypothetical protein QR98_0050320 [Sarcoptes scabiei]
MNSFTNVAIKFAATKFSTINNDEDVSQRNILMADKYDVVVFVDDGDDEDDGVNNDDDDDDDVNDDHHHCNLS